MTIDLSGLKQKAKIALLAIGGFIASVSNNAIDYYELQTRQLTEVVEEVQEKASDFQDNVDAHIQKGIEQAKQKLKPVKEAVKKAAKKVDEVGCKFGSKKDPRCADIYPLAQEEEDLAKSGPTRNYNLK